MYHYVVTSEKSAAELKDALYEVVPTIQFGILGELDLMEIMQKKVSTIIKHRMHLKYVIQNAQKH